MNLKWTLVLPVVLLVGCGAGKKTLQDTAEYFNSRNIRGCLCGDVHYGGGLGATANGSVKGVVVTGTMTPQQCAVLLKC